MKLLTETIDDLSTEILEEGSSGEKFYYITGPFLMGEVKNRNGRIYPMDVLRTAVKEYMPMIESKRSCGELQHPSTPQLNPDRISHLITELKEDGTNFIGKAKILKTPMGDIVKGLLEGGVRIGVSSRGLGSLKEDRDAKIVQNDLRFTTAADIVMDPSAHNALMDHLIEETEWVMNAGEWVPKFREKAKKELNEMVRQRESRQEREARYFKAWKRFMGNIGE